jgi:hypothetical protein
LGLSAVYALLGIRDLLKTIISRRTTPDVSHRASAWSLLTLAFLTLGLFILHMRENNLPDFEKFSAKTQRYRGLAEAGQGLNRLIADQAYVAGSEQLNDLIPAVSSKSKLITFRISQPSSMSYFPESQRLARIADMQRLFSKKSSSQNKMNLIEKYNIQFLFLQSADLRLFEDLITAYPNRVKKIEVGGVIILQIGGS